MSSGGAELSSDAQLSSMSLSEFGLRREPPRPVDDRYSDYEALFDFDTLFYDIFFGADGEHVVCLGPPLLNCREDFSRATFHLPSSLEPLHCEYRPPQTHFQPNCQFRLFGEGLPSASSIIVNLDGISVQRPIRPSGQGRFAGRRVIATMIKDCPLDWIGDWATFNRCIHGADAVILYDNASSAYGPGEVHEFLRGLSGFDRILAVSWPFPYGPGVGPKKTVQDSFYCQPGALEHLRRRYCPTARSVLHTDVDELVITPQQRSIFKLVEDNDCAAIHFPGIWVEKAGCAAPLPIRHTECLYLKRQFVPPPGHRHFDQKLRTKWIAVPKRCNDDLEWGVHGVYSRNPNTVSELPSACLLAQDIVYRHFRQITNGPNLRRRRVRRYSPFLHVLDKELARAFALAFPKRRLRASVSTRAVKRALRRMRS